MYKDELNHYRFIQTQERSISKFLYKSVTNLYLSEGITPGADDFVMNKKKYLVKILKQTCVCFFVKKSNLVGTFINVGYDRLRLVNLGFPSQTLMNRYRKLIRTLMYGDDMPLFFLVS